MKKNMYDRQCKECGRSFMGGPRAWYCHECRIERAKEAKRKHLRNKKLGIARALGSTDMCEICDKDYTVESGLQRYCPDCQPEQYAEHDRVSSLEFYHENKEYINPSRNERRRISRRNCEVCGKEIEPKNRALTCPEECRRIRKNRKWNERYHKLKQRERA